MVFNGLFPIGTVVLLKNSTKRVMITGVCQNSIGGTQEELYDYVGCPFPEGFLSADQQYLFNGQQIDRIFFIGLQDEESLLFKEKADAALKGLREAKETNKE